MQFRATVQLNGKTATGIEVPANVVEALGGGNRPAVNVAIGSHSYRSTIATMDGRFMLPLSAENREAAGVVAGDAIAVSLELDTAPREVVVPDDFGSALAADSAAAGFFEGLSYSNKRRLVLAIESAKAPETRARRIATTVARLHDGKV